MTKTVCNRIKQPDGRYETKDEVKKIKIQINQLILRILRVNMNKQQKWLSGIKEVLYKKE